MGLSVKLVALSALFVFGSTIGRAAPGPNGCYAYLGGTSGAPITIGEGATTENGIVGSGGWTVTITRTGVADPIVHTSPADRSPVVLLDSLQIGDRVTCDTDADGVVIAGRIA